ncbi:nuclear transport factor 2 family protein [Sphingobium baderi]|uniref:SnoaL-like domain-containing protein n=3 Tax=Sphingobium TaxID=165695 RepID=T0GH78_9SPHN|nr:nuclear transport factor 2 family protein [Sphingobium baderi]EQB00037.1 hypothetical protein L485_14025 [Sphingobium baderi LL03]WRD75694.1 nuclear transport factor 2 family protein [Sphingobium baderi]
MDRRAMLGGAGALAGAAWLPAGLGASVHKEVTMLSVEERLHAIEEISVLKARYFRFADTQDWNALRDLFTPDATLFFPEGQEKPLPRDESIAHIKKVLAGVVSVHHGHMPEIELLSADHATGIWAMEDLVFFPPDRARETGVESVHGFGHYHEEYVRRNGRWSIHRLKLTRLRLERRSPAIAIS